MSKIWHTRTVKYYSIIQQRKEWTADTNHMNEPWKHAKWKKRLHLVWFPWYEMSRIDTSSSSVAQSCPTLCEPVDRSTPGFPVQHQLLELTQTHVHRVGDAILPSHLLSPSPPAFNLSQHQGLFQWVNSSHQVAKVLEFQLQHQSFQWIFRTVFR